MTLFSAGTDIALVAPAGYASPGEFTAGIARLEEFGASVRSCAPAGDQDLPYLAASDAERAAELCRNWLHSEADILWAVRGGYGTLRLLELLPWAELAARPKMVAGFSDITGLHWAMTAMGAGIPVSAPMLKFLGEGLDDYSLRTLRLALCGEPLTLKLPALRGERAEGLALPGNLTVAASLAGTPWFPDLTGRIAVLEDVGEDPYRIDRRLTQLRLSGAFRHCRGVVFGDFTDCCGKGTVAAVLRDFAAKVTIPVFTGLHFGHGLPFCSLSGRQRLTVLASGGGGEQ